MYVLLNTVNMYKEFKGGIRIWTGDLLICSQMLYHWAIPPDDCSQSNDITSAITHFLLIIIMHIMYQYINLGQNKLF